MNPTMPLHIENDIRHADRRHPVDFIEPAPSRDDSIQRTCEVLRQTFGWVAQGATVEQKGLRASVVLYCVRADLIGARTLLELAALTGAAPLALNQLVADFCHRIDWK